MLENKKNCFFIMPFGKNDVEKIYSDAYLPVLKDLGIEACRVDQNSNGSIIEGIYQGISNSTIIIADITYARPNCYFEIGYTMGSGNKSNFMLICCREDHFDNNNDERIHFDLAGYIIHKWDLNEINDFKKRLHKNILILLNKTHIIQTDNYNNANKYQDPNFINHQIEENNKFMIKMRKI